MALAIHPSSSSQLGYCPHRKAVLERTTWAWPRFIASSLQRLVLLFWPKVFVPVTVVPSIFCWEKTSCLDTWTYLNQPKIVVKQCKNDDDHHPWSTRGLGILLLGPWDDVISPDLPRSLSLLTSNSWALMGPMELLDLRVRMLRRRRIQLRGFCWI